MVIGFTGTRRGMSRQQKLLVKNILLNLKPSVVHHGDCIGADSEFHSICKKMNIPIVIHPPVKNDLRAFCTGYKEIQNPLPYLQRNKKIVDSCDVLIGVPREKREQLRSGTWSTIRYAKKENKFVYIVF